MDSLGNEWQLTDSDGSSRPAIGQDILLGRMRRAETEVSRLENQLKSKEVLIAELQMALAHSAARQYAAENRLERELESVRAMASSAGLADGPAGSAICSSCDGQRDPAGGVIIHLPYVTAVLSALFDAMYIFWKDYDVDRPPKSSIVARAIDERLNFKPQSSGEASRSGQAYASAIRPDCIKEADNRHHVRRRI